MTSHQLSCSKMAIVMEGPLSKWTNVVKGWQYRWFVLDDNTGLLSYYTSKEKMMRGARRGCLRLKGANLGIDDEDDSTFTISCDQKTFHFQARDAEEREQWIRGLEDTIKRHSQVRKRQVMGRDFEHFDPTKESLDQRLAEAEAYNKILTNQIKIIKNQMNADLDSQTSQRYAILKESSENMLESIGQCLELMYTIKKDCEKCVTKVPKDSLPMVDMVSDHYSEVPTKSTAEEQQTPNDILSMSPKAPSDKIDINPERRTIRPSKSESSLSLEKQSPPNAISDDAEIKLSRAMSKSSFELTTPTTEVTSINFETPTMTPEYSISRTSLPTMQTMQTGTYSSHVSYAIASPVVGDITVPYASYSSSDEEDVEFFDASEFSESSSEKKDELTSSQKTSTLQAAILDDEDEYEPADEDVYGRELGADAVEQHSSVISHLLSQVRLGMDLTKVVLPTFILETRSLLEMYADFFSHPDLFVGIVDKKTPEERIIQVLRWYLSAMSAGRKGSVAKKPYNPILGETFRCFWTLPEYAVTRDKTPVSDGPVPWASKDDVTFLAEQVSHHPPISAFYAENRTKEISFGAHIWTKSKFLGLSIGVENVGQGCVSVIPHDEEYVLTFPNGYGRSILTVPWMEIGGKGTITCAKTGYNACIQFHCKPFYGGKKHRVTCEVTAPNEKKPFLTINGEWNGLMFSKYADKEEEELFIDAKNFPTYRKLVKKIEKQQENESKRLWQDVTINLKKSNVDKATEGKHKLEEKQREEARERKENGTQWETKLFHEVGSHWLYDRPLQKILSEESEGQAKASD